MTPTKQQIEAAAVAYARGYSMQEVGFVDGANWALQQLGYQESATFSKPNNDSGVSEFQGFTLCQLVRVVANVDYFGGTGEITIIEPDAKRPFRVDFTSIEWAFYKADEIAPLPEPPQQ